MAALAGLILAVLTSIVVTVGPAQACSCVHPPESDQTLLERADVVFEGVALDVRNVAPADSPYPGLGRLAWRFDVDRVVKGSPSNPLEIDTAGDSAMCGFGFEVGVAYRVFAMNSQAGPSVNLCGGTKRLSDVVPELTTTVPTTARPLATTPATTAVVRPTTSAAVVATVVDPTIPVATTTTIPPLTSEIELVDSDEGEGSAGALVAAGAAAMVLGALGYRVLRLRRST